MSAPEVLAEDVPIGTMLEWPSPPRVAAQVGLLPFAAPSAIGRVTGVIMGLGGTKRAVRFRYRNPTGGQSWSEPIAVLPGQPCKVVTP